MDPLVATGPAHIGNLYSLVRSAVGRHILSHHGACELVPRRVCREPVPSCQDVSHGNQMGEHGIHRFVLRVALGPAAYTNRKHLLVDIVVIAVCGMLCGCDGPTAIHRWADESPGLAGEFLAFPTGFPRAIASVDC